MKILILINEDFTKMALGKNTTLAYALASVDLNHDVYICQISSENFIDENSKFIKALHINNNNASELVASFKSENKKIADAFWGLENQGSTTKLVEDFCQENKIFYQEEIVELLKIDFVIQRLEPMKWPFAPFGNFEINQYLLALKKVFSKKNIFNFAGKAFLDKELPLVLDKKYQDLATPTQISFYDDLNLAKKAQEIAQKYSEIFATNVKKIVIKPDNSAQALGVFAIEIDNFNGLNLEELQEKTVANLKNIQLYEVNCGKDENELDNLKKIIQILCFVQFCKNNDQDKNFDDKKISEISATEIANCAKLLYTKNILLQPFLEGVRLGDIRVNLTKFADGNFKIVGAVFRKSISYEEENFTTCLTTGASTAQSVDGNLLLDEKNDLAKKIAFILQQLNSDGALKYNYRQVLEIGCDFLIIGNKKQVYFGEANHYCPALVPFSEAINNFKNDDNFYKKINGLSLDYQGGIGIIKEIIKQQILLQNNH